MQLSTNFTSEELTVTDTGLYNTPNESSLNNLKYLTDYILQPIRNRWGIVTVTSGYRSDEVNTTVGGIASSAHLKGRAVDFIPMEADINVVFDWIVAESGLTYGSVIFEHKGGKRWIHVSLPRLHRRNNLAMVYIDGEYNIYEGTDDLV